METTNPAANPGRSAAVRQSETSRLGARSPTRVDGVQNLAARRFQAVSRPPWIVSRMTFLARRGQISGSGGNNVGTLACLAQSMAIGIRLACVGRRLPWLLERKGELPCVASLKRLSGERFSRS